MQNEDVLYQALLTRDYRFDGKFFVAVKTTGIYCRPICRVRTPQRKNVEFFTHAAAAERAGYRPCLRCRPECAPASPSWQGSTVLVQRALKLIAANGMLGEDEEGFVERLGGGVTARHLRRLFAREIGQTPKQISDVHRLNFARKLVVETRLPLTTVAMSAGFGSLRRFNHAFKCRFKRAPSQLRRRKGLERGGGEAIELSLAYRPPYHWAAIHDFYGRHAIPGVERVGPGYYERLFRIGAVAGLLRVGQGETAERGGGGGKPELRLRVHCEDPAVLFEVMQRVRRMFDLEADPLLVANSFGTHPVLQKLYEKHPGLRLPRGWDPFETAVCAILGQLVSVEYARTLAGQLVSLYGDACPHPVTGELIKLFPTPERLAECDLAGIGTTGARRAAVRELARQVRDGTLQLSDAQDPANFRASLLAIRGIGQWTAEYMSLRCIGDTDAFPASDLILKRAVEQHALDVSTVKPWRAYAAVYLWREFAKTLSRKKGATS
jgi:AraC family transcriptional regulator of adaptative response / DNA-3-methyladenine glycosylase II